MAKYTTQVKTIIEYYSDPNKTMIERIKESCPKIFDFPFPIWDEEYRTELESKILTHYISKEIGFETVGLWKLYLFQRMNEIMPYYNKMYSSTTQLFKDAYDMDTTEILSRTLNGENQNTSDYNNKYNANSTNKIESENKNLNLAYPQAEVEGDVNNLFYGTDGSTLNENTSNTNTQEDTTINHSENNGSSRTTEEHTITRKGISGSKSPWEIIKEYRTSLINIDLLIINELKDLFMMIY